MRKSELKIACVENMNNNMFAIMRHLRHRGYNAELITSKEFEHFQPAADTFEETYFKYIKEFDYKETDILHTDKLAVNRFFSKYNFIIACGYSIACLTFSKVKIDIVIPYGSDLYDLPFFEPKDSGNEYFIKQKTTLAKYQKKGIEGATAVIFDYTNEEFEKVIDRFNLKGTRYKYTCPFIYTPEFNWKNSSTLQNLSQFSPKMIEIRNKFDFIAFSHIRQSWKNPLDVWSYKGNDRIFRAFKKFLNSTDAKACLIVFEYGTCIEDSKKMVTELGIQQNVIWFPIMQRKDILSMISFVDIGIGEIGNNSWFSYGAIFEFLCMKKPVIHYRDDKMYNGKVESFYPMYCASSEQGVLSALTDCYTNKTKANQIAEEAYNWYIDNAIEKPIQILTSVMSFTGWFLHSVKKRANRAIISIHGILGLS